MKDFNLVSCDDFSRHENTYSNVALNHTSCIDHLFVSCKLFPNIVNSVIINHDANHSDHKPVSCEFNVSFQCGSCSDKLIRRDVRGEQFKARWDKANLNDYYYASSSFLDNVITDCCNDSCTVGCDYSGHSHAIDNLYNSIVYALQQAEQVAVPRIPYKSLKPFWTEHLDDLKEKSVFWGRLWVDAGRPRSGELFKLKSACSLRYKAAIRQAVIDYDNTFDNDLYEYFTRKEPTQFWKCWHNKFSRVAASDRPLYIGGLQNTSDIAQAFADSFGKTYYNSYDDIDTNQSYLDLVNDTRKRFDPDNCGPSVGDITVELVDKNIRALKLGKACGPDGLSAEHLIYAHPKLVTLLTRLFRCMASHSFVPTDFGKGIIVPLIKDKCGDVSDLSNYRAITLTPVISKLFERVVLDLCNDLFCTEDVQFGFKKGLSCTNAIFAVRSTVDYFVERGSTVYAAALDIRKAYDTVHHIKLFTALLKAGFPSWVVTTLMDWYSKLFAAVRWLDSFSAPFQVRSGCSQGSSLSPALFNLFINSLIVQLKDLGLGCQLNRTWVGCIMYADDALLLSTSVRGLQTMLDHCGLITKQLKLVFNCSKCLCIAFGPKFKHSLAPLYLNNESVDWSCTLKYLGVTFIAGAQLSCNIDVAVRKFYAASNCIFNNSNSLDDLLQLHLQQSYCLPLLSYGMSGVRLNASQLRTLNACWNNVFRKIFHYNKWDSVKLVIEGLGLLNFTHLYYLSVVKLIKTMLCSNNLALRNIVGIFCKSSEWEKFCANCGISISNSIFVVKQIISARFRNLCL